MQLKTEISAKFVTSLPPETTEAQVSLDALNKHVEDICETLQPIFVKLIVEMLELKRATHTKG
jgi:hypothetical protein